METGVNESRRTACDCFKTERFRITALGTEAQGSFWNLSPPRFFAVVVLAIVVLFLYGCGCFFCMQSEVCSDFLAEKRENRRRPFNGLRCLPPFCSQTCCPIASSLITPSIAPRRNASVHRNVTAADCFLRPGQRHCVNGWLQALRHDVVSATSSTATTTHPPADHLPMASFERPARCFDGHV